jgi:hypothetical protein
MFQLGVSKVVADGVTLTKYVAHALCLTEDYVNNVVTSTEDLQRYKDLKYKHVPLGKYKISCDDREKVEKRCQIAEKVMILFNRYRIDSNPLSELLNNPSDDEPTQDRKTEP